MKPVTGTPQRRLKTHKRKTADHTKYNLTGLMVDLSTETTKATAGMVGERWVKSSKFTVLLSTFKPVSNKQLSTRKASNEAGFSTITAGTISTPHCLNAQMNWWQTRREKWTHRFIQDRTRDKWSRLCLNLSTFNGGQPLKALSRWIQIPCFSLYWAGGLIHR